MKNITNFIYEANADRNTVKVLMIQAWNSEKISKQIESAIKSMGSKDPKAVNIDQLAGSSIIKKICSACIKEEDPHMKVDAATKQEFYYQLAQEMIDKMIEPK